jgi:hypothetical protein
MAGLKKPKSVAKVMPIRRPFTKSRAIKDLETKLKERREKMGKKKPAK